MGALAETVLITGAASGIGRATAIRLSERMRVVVADRNGDAARVLAEDIKRDGRHALAVEVDVSQRESVAAMMRIVEREMGSVHALFSNAGINRRAPVESITEADWDAMIQTHVKGGFLCAQAVLPGMKQRHSGAILMMSSDFAAEPAKSCTLSVTVRTNSNAEPFTADRKLASSRSIV